MRATGSAAELAALAEHAVENRGLVVACGGDGTYLATLSALVTAARGRPLPPLAFAHGGTVSIVAKNFGAPGDLLALAKRVVDEPHRLRLVPRPTLSIDDGETVRTGFTFGTGLVSNFFDVYERGGARGNGQAATIALRTLFGSITGGELARRILSPLRCTLEVDGARLAPEAWSLVVVSVLADVGLGFRVNHRAGEDPGRPHVVASPLGARALGPQAFRVLRGKPLAGAGNFDGLVSELRVTFPAEGAYVLDGDTFRARAVTVRAGPTIFVAC